METAQVTGRQVMVMGTGMPPDIKHTGMYPGVVTGTDMDIPGMDMDFEILDTLMATDTMGMDGIGKKRYPSNPLKFHFHLEPVTPFPKASSRYLLDGS
jgi:hypothetical protein